MAEFFIKIELDQFSIKIKVDRCKNVYIHVKLGALEKFRQFI